MLARESCGSYLGVRPVEIFSSKSQHEDVRLRLRPSQPCYDLWTINQTMCCHVQFIPFAIGINMKTPDDSEPEATLQLGIWAVQFNRLEYRLAHTSSLVCVRRGWFLCFACHRLDIFHVPSQHVLFVRLSYFGRNCFGPFHWRYEICGGCYHCSLLFAALAEE